MTHKSYILIVDDETLMASLYQQILAEGGRRVLTAASAADALSTIEREGLPALIILDFSMHRMSGNDFLDAFEKLKPDRAACKVIGFSSHTRDSAVIREFVRRVDGYGEKPESVDQFLAFVTPFL